MIISRKVQRHTFDAELFPHQQESIERMEKLEHERSFTDGNTTYSYNYGINGDIPGYGKTYSMIGLIVNNKMPYTPTNTVNYYNNNQFHSYHTVFVESVVHSNLIVVPLGVFSHWKKIIGLTNMSFVCINTSKLIDIDWDNPPKIILITSTMLRNFHRVIGYKTFHRLIIDEADSIIDISPRIKVHNFVKGRFTWFVTGTPNRLYHLSMGRVKDYVLIKNDISSIQKSIKLDKPVEIIHRVIYNKLVDHIKPFISDEVAEMIAANDYQKAVLTMGGNVNDNIVETIRNKYSKKIKKLRSKLSEFEDEDDDENADRIKRKIDKNEKQLADLEERLKNYLDSECCICASDLEKPVCLNCCFLVICSRCLFGVMDSKIGKKDCPLCRNEIKPELLTYIKAEGEQEVQKNEKNDNPVPPVETLVRLLEKSDKDDRFLVFAEYDGQFKNLQKDLTEHDIPFASMKGTVHKRDNILKNYNNGKYKVMLLQTAHAGAGINLEKTTDIVLFHSLKESDEKQVIGRAMRIGRSGILKLHRFIHE